MIFFLVQILKALLLVYTKQKGISEDAQQHCGV